MPLITEPYLSRLAHWPQRGQYILAQFDDEKVVVYQAYRPSIGEFAASHGYFGEGFSMNRMSWIKPNFLWMMYRCGWATKPDQQTVLAISVRRSAFEAILVAAVPSSHTPRDATSRENWRATVASSDVRLQWDPDHDPYGAPTQRRALQLGLRGTMLRRFCTESIIAIDDITAFVHQQHQELKTGGFSALITPGERVYPTKTVSNHAVCES